MQSELEQRMKNRNVSENSDDITCQFAKEIHDSVEKHGKEIECYELYKLIGVLDSAKHSLLEKLDECLKKIAEGK